MTNLHNRTLCLSLVLLGCVLFGCGTKNPRVKMVTELGPISIEVYKHAAPVTAGNFLRYVDEGRFEGAKFYRVVTMQNQPDKDIKIEVIQGGLGNDENHPKRLPSMGHETTQETGILHKDGVISMARIEPGTADAEIFICVGDQPDLDFEGRRNPDGQGFAAFGQVIDGMEVVRRIQQQPEMDQALIEPVKITSMTRLP